jgi:hypothetical protein
MYGEAVFVGRIAGSTRMYTSYTSKGYIDLAFHVHMLDSITSGINIPGYPTDDAIQHLTQLPKVSS